MYCNIFLSKLRMLCLQVGFIKPMTDKMLSCLYVTLH